MCGKKDPLLGDFSLTKGMLFQEFSLTKPRYTLSAFLSHKEYAFFRNLLESRVCEETLNIQRKAHAENPQKGPGAQNISLTQGHWRSQKF